MKYASEIVALVGLAVGVVCKTAAGVVFGRVGWSTALGGELIGDLLFFLLLGHLSYI